MKVALIRTGNLENAAAITRGMGYFVGRGNGKLHGRSLEIANRVR